MTAQIRPNRLEVSDRFPMLGFSIRADQRDVEAEVALATDIALFKPENKSQRTAANFYSSREGGTLSVPRGEGVFVVPPEVLTRFIGGDRLYFGLASGHANNGGLQVDALPRDGSPFVSLRGLTGRTLRRPALGRRGGSAPVFDWAGDAAKPGSEPASPAPSAANGGNGAAPAAAGSEPPAGQLAYDDGFGNMPARPQPASAPTRAMTIGIEDVERAQAYAPRWRDLFTWSVPASVVGAVTARGFSIQSIADAAGELNLDRYEVEIDTMPGGMDGGALLTYFRQNINTFLDTRNTEFLPYESSDQAKIQSTDPVGGVWKLDIAGPDNAAVVISASTPNYFRVTTIVTPDTGDHPVSGHREFGFSARGAKTVFYTRGADRSTHGIGETLVFAGADHLWKSFQTKLVEYVNANGGAASAPPRFSERFHPEVVRILYGTAQSLAAAQSAYAGALAHVDMVYTPSDPTQAATALADFSRREAAWRAGVPATTFFPHSAICHLVMTDSAGTRYYGTGFYVASDLILTVAHNLYQMASVEIRPGRNGESSFLANFNAGPSDWTIHPNYVPDVTDFDLAVIRVSTPPQAGPSFTLEELLVCQESPIIVCGYGAQTVDPFKQHLDGDHIRDLSANGQVMRYNLQTEKGNSGSPVFYVDSYDDAERQQCVMTWKLVGVHSASHNNVLNQACALTQAKINWINGRGLAAALALGVEDAQGEIVRPQLPNEQRARAARIGGQFGDRIGQALDLGLAPASVDPLLDKLDPRATARPLSAEPRGGAMAGGEWTVNWDEVDLIAQPTNFTCWAAAGSMVVGWRDHVSLSPETVARICRRSTGAGLASNDNAAFAAEMGLTPEQPMCYTEEGFRDLLRSKGPLWVSEHPDGNPAGNFHAVVVTGMYFDGTDYYVRIADPWDRAIGLPGSPGGYASTHATGSRYIMRWADFARQYEGAISGNPANQQILHANGTHGHVLNTVRGAKPPGFAMSADGKPAGDRTLPAPPSPRARGMEAGVLPIETTRGGSGTITWELDRLQEFKHPGNTPPASRGQTRTAQTIRLDTWPTGGPPGREVSAFFGIDWQYDGKSLGNVEISNLRAREAEGRELDVRARIIDDPELHQPGGCAALKLAFVYRFRGDGPERKANIEIRLFGDGTHEMNCGWEETPTAVAASVQSSAMQNHGGRLCSATDTNRDGPVSWAVDRFAQFKYPNDQEPANPGTRVAAQPVTVSQPGPPSTSFQINWQHDGLSLGNVEIINAGPSQGAGRAVVVSAQIFDLPALHNGCAQLRVRFFYQYMSDIGVPDGSTAIDVTLRGDGTAEVRPN